MKQTRIFHDLNQLRQQVAAWRLRSGKIVFTNGCFDMLHPGHISLLETAAAFGDYLVVGLNDDKSIRNLKGPQRPIMDVESRLRILSALRVVDAVIPFSDPTPIALIQTLEPDVLVKGGDYTIDQTVGADFVKSYGGRVEIVPFVPGFSSSKIIDKILNKTK